MGTAIVLFYSISGSTRRVVEGVARGLQAEGTNVTLHDLRGGLPARLASYDLVGVASPTHYFRLPAPVTGALKRIGDLRGHAGFAVVTYGTFRGRALNTARRLLRAAHLAEIGTLTARGEGLHLLYLRQGCLTSPGHPTDAEIESAEDFGRTVALRLNAFRGGDLPPARTPLDPATHWVYALERAITGPRLSRAFYSRFFRADEDTCNRCGLCARECPTGNISFRRGEIPVWGRDCIICGTCARVCPREAVRSPLDWAVFRPFAMYNVRRAEADVSVETERVTHRMGRTHAAS
ncbi:MAG: 4Fe-4S binding protein [Coriobacteriia bacterium]